MPVTINGTTGVVTPGATIGSINGILKSTAGVVSQAVSGTDFSSGIQGAKAWVNFDGTTIGTSTANTSQSVSVIAGSDIGTFNNSGTWTSNFIGQTYYINSIAGVSGATLGGVDVAISGIKIISASGTSATVKLLGGVATSSQTITGTGSPSTGFVFSTSGIRSSYNVSSVTKNGTGDYTVNFATALADANYASSSQTDSVYGSANSSLKTNSSHRIKTYNASASIQDYVDINLTIFGN